MKTYIGIDIGGTKCAVVKGCSADEIENKISFKTEDLATTLEKIFEAVETLMPCDGIGISCGGPLDEELGIIQSPPNLPGWDNVHITEMLGKRFSVPVKLRNDANACALAEWRFGAGKGTRNMVFLTFGTGLGAGLILDGKLYSGSCGMAGEVGHIRLAEDGPVGYGKTGSFEGFCSGGGIAELAKRYVKSVADEGREVAFCKVKNGLDGITAKLVCEYAALGDSDAKAIIKQSAEKLGYGLSVLIDILNPDAVVIGSVYARNVELFYDTAMNVIKREALTQSANACRLIPSGLGERIGDVAALSVAMES